MPRTVPSSAAAPDPSRFLNKRFILLFIQNFCIFCSFAVMTVLPDHLARIGASKTYVGLFMNINSLALVILVVPLSRYADRIGRKRLILSGYALALVSAVLSFFFYESLGILGLLRVLGVLLFCAVFTIQGTEAFGLFTRERRMSGMAVFGISGMSSNPVGAFIGERLIEGPGVPWLFVAVFILGAVGMAIAAFYPYHEPGRGERPTSIMKLARGPELAPLFALSFMLGGAFTVFSTFLANMTRLKFGTVRISPFFLFFSVVAILIRIFLTSLVEGTSPRRITSFCFALIAVAFLLTFGLRDPYMLAPIGLLYGMGQALRFPLVSTLFVNAGRDEDRLGLNNLFSGVNTLGGIVSAVLMGVVADLAGVPAVFLVMAFLTALMVPVGFVGLRGRMSARGGGK